MALEHESDSPLAKAVRAAGSQSAFGRLLRRRGKPVGQSTVRVWLLSNRLPGEHVLTIEAATGVPKEQLRPDLYRDEHTSETASDILERAAAPAAASGSMDCQQ